MVDDTPPEPHDDYPDDWETFWRGDTAWGRTDDGKEFQLDAGSTEPQDGRCGAPLTDYERRYGEIRYCTQMPVSKFVDGGSDYCKTHKSMDALMDRAAELVQHGAFGRSYVIFSRSMDPLEFISAVEIFDGLLMQSRHEFEVEYEERTVDTSESDLILENEVAVELPFPTNSTYKFQYKELWQAALDEVKVERMQHCIFDDGVSQKTIAQAADMEGKITDTKYESEEHHLHLSISRLTKDMKEHLKNGGVSIGEEDENGVVTFEKNDYTLDIKPDSDADSNQSDAPEAISAEEFTQELEADETDEEAAEIALD